MHISVQITVVASTLMSYGTQLKCKAIAVARYSCDHTFTVLIYAHALNEFFVGRAKSYYVLFGLRYNRVNRVVPSFGVAHFYWVLR